MTRPPTIEFHIGKRQSMICGIHPVLSAVLVFGASAMAAEIHDAVRKGDAAAVTLISDARQRNLCIENLARQWLRSDPEAARIWLDTLDLPADQIERLMKSVPQRFACTIPTH